MSSLPIPQIYGKKSGYDQRKNIIQSAQSRLNYKDQKILEQILHHPNVHDMIGMALLYAIIDSYQGRDLLSTIKSMSEYRSQLLNIYYSVTKNVTSKTSQSQQPYYQHRQRLICPQCKGESYQTLYSV